MERRYKAEYHLTVEQNNDNMTWRVPKTGLIHVNLLCIPWTKEGDTSQIFQIKMQHNSLLFRIFWQGMQNLEFLQNYRCHLVKQYASRKNLAIFSRLCLVQVVPQNLAMVIQSQRWASCLLSHLFWSVFTWQSKWSVHFQS